MGSASNPAEAGRTPPIRLKPDPTYGGLGLVR